MTEEVVRRLREGRPLDGLDLGTVEGRWDLRGVVLGSAVPKSIRVAGRDASVLSGTVELDGVVLEGLDLAGCDWRNLRLTDVVLRNCVLDGAQLRGLRVWRVDVADCSFVRADLRDASTGGGTPFWRRRPSRWTRVDFAGADLRGSAHGDELFTDCSFDHARLDGVDFWGARHVRSRFVGPVREVSFHRYAPGAVLRNGPGNQMVGVDFSQAQLDGCSFWGLDLAEAILPEGDQHVIFANKVQVARAVLADLERQGLGGRLVSLRVIMERVIEEGPNTAVARKVVHRDTLGDSDGERREAEAFLRSHIGT